MKMKGNMKIGKTNIKNSCFHMSISAATAMVEGKLGKSLKKVLKKIVAKEAHEQLAITDAKLGGVIKVNMAGFPTFWGGNVSEIPVRF